MNPFTRLETVMIINKLETPIKARFIGKSPNGFLFQSLTSDFGQIKGGGKMIRVNGFRLGEKCEGRQTVIIN
jgi:hypothetical protein